MTDPYQNLVQYYDVENADLVEDLAAYRLLSDRFGGPVLDVGCGTGRVSFDLAAKKGLSVLGVDSSEAMLQQARKCAEKCNLTIDWVKADIRTLALEKQFGVAIFAYNGFMHLLAQPDQIAALSRIYAHLKPGGGLVVDLPNPVEMFRADDTPGLVVERMFTDPATNEVVMQQSIAEVDRAEQIMHLTWVYDRIGSDGSVHRDLVPLQLRYTVAAELQLLLERVGFQVDMVCGDYEFSAYEEESPRLFVVATRPEDVT